MPELPEAETVRRGLIALVGKRIARAEVFHPRTARKQTEGLGIYSSKLPGATVNNVARRGKFIWLGLNMPDKKDLALVIHLGMSGQALLDSPSFAGKSDSGKHLRALLEFSDGWNLRFIDQRTFGYWEICPYRPTEDNFPGGWGEEMPRIPLGVAHIGRDALDPYLNVTGAALKIKNSTAAIKTRLLDQSLVSGVGNIYADEALGRAKINPALAANRLSLKRITGLLEEAAQVMDRAIAAGGTSFDELYVDTNGFAGWFARELFFYGRAGECCRQPGCGAILEKTQVGGRSSTWCPQCQPRR